MAKWGFPDASAEVERLRVELEQARKDRDQAREWLGAANNEFGSAAWDWPDLWRRIAKLKELSNERWRRAEQAEDRADRLQAERDGLQSQLTQEAEFLATVMAAKHQAETDLAALKAEADHSEDGLWRFWSDKAMALARSNDQLRAERDDLAARLQSIQQAERKYTAAKLTEAAKMRKGQAI